MRKLYKVVLTMFPLFIGCTDAKVKVTALASKLTPLNVSVEQSGSQSDPTNNSLLSFEVVFSEDINPASFVSSDITNSGSAAIGVWTITQTDLKNFTISTIASTSGTVVPSIVDGMVLSAIGLPSSASVSLDNSVSFDNTLPVITNVTGTEVNGTYTSSNTLSINITFSENVLVNTTGGTPTLTLETGATDQVITYASGSGTNILTFNFTIAASSFTADLDYLSTSALVLNGGTIKDSVNNSANLLLPALASAQSLSGNKNYNIVGTPTVLSISDGATYDYGTKTLSSTTDKTFTLTNTGFVSATSLSGTGLSGAFVFKGGAYPGIGGDCSTSLSAAGSCTIVVSFSPSALGLVSSSIDIAYNNGISMQNAVRAIQGTGTNVAPPPTIAYGPATTSPTSTGNNPTFTVSGISSGDTVQIKQGSCAGTVVGSGTSVGTSIDITTAANLVTENYYYFYAVVTSPNVSSCVNFTAPYYISYIYDPTPPTNPSNVDDGYGTPVANISPAINFEPSTYEVSGLSYQARVIRFSDSFAMSSWISVGAGSTISGLSLTVGTQYRTELRALNGAGLMSAVVQGDGWYYDDSAPTTAPGTPSLGAVPNYLDRTPTLTFTPAVDPTTNIAYYEVQVYDSLNNIIVPWSKLTGGSGSPHQFPGTMLINQTQYYVRVRGINPGGLASPVSAQSANWSAGCNATTISISGNTAYSTSESSYCFAVPGGVTVINVKTWGGGGGGSISNGGAGGFASGSITVTPGELLLITVAGGGEKGDLTLSGNPGYGGGGKGFAKGPGSSYHWGAGGGGMTGIFRATTALVIAGGGGGGQGDVTPAQAGVGGGLTGGDDSDSNSDGGKGGTQISGGVGALACGQNGSYLKGGDSGQLNTSWGGGGGGGAGYFGGGGGCRGGSGRSKSGGGGSSYLEGGVGSAITQSGTNTVPFGSADPDRTSGGAPANVGYGGAGVQNGGPGRIFISW